MKNDEKPKYFGKDLEAMSFATNYHRWIINEFKPYLGGKTAEVGAGTGNFSELLIDQDITRLVAFEPSANIYPFLEDRFSENRKIVTINRFFGNEYDNFERFFDSVVYVNVLEHIEDDEKELSNIYKSLRNGGHALIFVPALAFLYSQFDKSLGHFRRYHKQEFAKLIQRAGFKIINLKYFDFAGIIPWYINFVLLKKTITGAAISLYDKLVVPFIQKIEEVIVPPLGKNLLLIAQKT